MSFATQVQLVQEVHARSQPFVLAVTGGGSRAISALLTQSGASRTVLEATIPYSAGALRDWLGSEPEQYCSDRTARAMAMVAYLRARRLAPDASVLGFAATASLASDRPKRGPHRVYIAWQSAEATATAHLELAKDARTRAEEEELVAQLILSAIAEATGAGAGIDLALLAGEHVEHTLTRAQAAEQGLLANTRQLLARCAAKSGELPRAVFPGAFNPLHAGHRKMAAVAARLLGVPVAFEISIENVDKPLLDFLEIHTRLAQFGVDDAVWLTRAPTFVKKSELFPGCTFVVGVDTLERIGHERYYGSLAAMLQAIDQIAASGCRFLVFGRSIGGAFRTLDDVELPERLVLLCRGVPVEDFREDVSSTELRKQNGAAQGDGA